MEQNYYAHRYSITAADMDTQYRMTANAVLLYYQDCWARYMSCLHLAAFDMVHRHRMWVISEFNASWEQQDAFWSQEVEVKVWNSELTGLRLYADFLISKQDGTPLSHGYGCWTLLDIESHRPTVISDAGVETLRIAETAKHTKNRIPAPRTVISETEHRVNPINLDFNGHVNNRTYLHIAMQTVTGERVDNRCLQSLTIRWLHESFLGDTLICRLADTGQENTFLHVISKDDTPVAQICSVLMERTRSSVIDDEAPRL